MDIPDTKQDCVDELTAEFIELCRAGDAPDVESYVTSHPELADTIRDLFPMIAALESMKRDDRKEIARTATQLPLDLKELGDFEIVREIGRGGMGIVYEARQRTLDRRVALKILPKQSLLDPVQLKRFEREARIVARLHHTNVVSLYGAGEHNGFHFLVMELVQGESLGRVIQALKANKPEAIEMPESLRRYGTRRHWRELARIGRDAALGLQHAHEVGILHRDITPTNLLLDERGNVMLSDFGMARMVSAHENSGTQTMGGTLSYIPPEVFSGKFNERSDVFGLGVTLYEFLTLQPAFTDATPAEALKRVAENSFRPTPPSSITASIPKDLETIILKSIADQPSQRYASASDLADDLQRFLELRPIKARRSSVFEHAWRWGRRNIAVAALSTLALLSLVALSILMTFSFIQARSAQLSVESALARETKHRERLDATVNVATNVLNNIYDELVPSDLQAFDDSQPESGSEAIQTTSPMLSDEMVAVLDNLLEFYDQLAEQGGDNHELMTSSVSALARVADIYRQLGQPSKALAHYTTAIKTLDQLKKHQQEDSFPSLQQARIYNEIGRLHYVDDRQKEAIDNHREALNLLDAVDAPPAETRSQWLYETARAHYFLGRKKNLEASEVAMINLRGRGPGVGRPDGPRGGGPDGPRGGRPDGPRGGGPDWIPSWLRPTRPGGDNNRRREHLHDAIETLQRLAADDQKRPEQQFLLACCYRELSGPNEQLEPENSDGSIGHSIELLTDLVNRFENNPLYRYELTQTLRLHEKKSPRTIADMNRTLDSLESALRHADYLTTHHPNVPQYAMARMHVLHRQGHVLTDRARDVRKKYGNDLLSQAVVSLEKALAQTEILIERWPDQLSHKLWSIVVSGSLGKTLLDLDQNEKAASVLGDAMVLLSELEPLVDRDSPLHRQLSDVRRALRDLVEPSER